MDKKEAISIALEKRKAEAEYDFKCKVGCLINEIEALSDRLRKAKLELKNLEYVEPTVYTVDI